MASEGRPSDDDDASASQGPSKRPRVFVARQACERCRSKKTRCDENEPCSLCRSLGVECKYGDRKTTRNEASFSAMYSFLRRIESKIESLVQPQSLDEAGSGPAIRDMSIAALPTMPLPNDQPELGWLNVVNQVNAIVPRSPSLLNASPDVAPLNPSHSNPISFSAHKILDWPLITSQLPEEVQAIYQNCGPDYATLMEMKRPNVPATRMADLAGETSVLAKLSLSIVKQICDAFFTTFNLAHPIVDQKFFLHHTLPIAIQRGFEADVESCVVLAVMALGCWSIQAIERAGYSKNRYDKDLRLDNFRVRGIPGLFFHNHARIRHGFLVNDHSMQSCQFHLLSGLFYGVLMRPIDWWSSISRAATCALTFWECVAMTSDDWIKDMQSRLYWIAFMFEAILTEEYSLPASRLKEIQERIPFPRFLKPNSYVFMSSGDEYDNKDEYHDWFHEYHFLSQIAHRILVTRTKNSIYYSLPLGNYPAQSLEEELSHQLEQWREQLPPSLRFDRDDVMPPPPKCPTDVLVVAWLRSRYLILRIHLGRPFLHRVLCYPDQRISGDLDKCREVLNDIFSWKSILEVILSMEDCMLFKSNVCAQIFGQLLLVYCCRKNQDAAIVGSVPSAYRTWCSFSLELLQRFAPLSPTVARDAQIASILCRDLLETQD